MDGVIWVKVVVWYFSTVEPDGIIMLRYISSAEKKMEEWIAFD